MTEDDKPMFVKITGPGRYQVKPYGRGGWLLMGAWVVAHLAVMSLLLIESVRANWWIVVLLDCLVTVPFVVFAVRTATPIEQIGRKKRRP